MCSSDLAALAEGLRSEMLGTPIKISTLYPGYIRSAINEKVKNAPFIVDTETGCKALVKAINKEPAKAYVPAWPWAPLGLAMRVLPLAVVRRMSEKPPDTGFQDSGFRIQTRMSVI